MLAEGFVFLREGLGVYLFGSYKRSVVYLW